MPDYYRMNKILEEEGTCERSQAEEDSYVEHQIDVELEKQADYAEELASQEE